MQFTSLDSPPIVHFLCMWNGKTGKELHYLGRIRDAWAMALSHNGRSLLTGGSDKILRLWSIPSDNALDYGRAHDDDSVVLFAPREALSLVTSIGTTIPGRPTGALDSELNKLLNAKGWRLGNQFIIDLGVDKKRWPAASGCFPLQVSVFDNRGKRLDQFATGEVFTADREAFKLRQDAIVASPGNRDPRRDELQEPRPILLKSTGNRLTYIRDIWNIKEAARIEVGFFSGR